MHSLNDDLGFKLLNENIWCIPWRFILFALFLLGSLTNRKIQQSEEKIFFMRTELCFHLLLNLFILVAD